MTTYGPAGSPDEPTQRQSGPSDPPTPGSPEPPTAARPDADRPEDAATVRQTAQAGDEPTVRQPAGDDLTVRQPAAPDDDLTIRQPAQPGADEPTVAQAAGTGSEPTVPHLGQPGPDPARSPWSRPPADPDPTLPQWGAPPAGATPAWGQPGTPPASGAAQPPASGFPPPSSGSGFPPPAPSSGGGFPPPPGAGQFPPTSGAGHVPPGGYPPPGPYPPAGPPAGPLPPGVPPAGGQWGVPGGYGAPPAPPKKRGGRIALIIGLVVLLLVCPCLGLTGWAVWQAASDDSPSGSISEKTSVPVPPGQDPLPTAEPSPTESDDDFRPGDCVVNDGTDDEAELRKVPCGPNTYEVLLRIPASTDGDRCQILAPDATANYVHDNPANLLDYVLCLKER